MHLPCIYFFQKRKRVSVYNHLRRRMHTKSSSKHFSHLLIGFKVICHSYNHCWCISFLGRCFGFAAAMECCSQRCAWSFGPKWLLESRPAYGLSWPGTVKGDIWWDFKWPLIWGSYSVSAVFLGVRYDKVDQNVGTFAYLSTYSLTFQGPG